MYIDLFSCPDDHILQSRSLRLRLFFVFLHAMPHSFNTSTPTSATPLGRILRYTGLFGGVQGANVLMSALRSKLTALLLSTRGMGMIGNFARSVELVGAATNLGLSFSAVRRIALLSERGNARAVHHYVCLVRSWALLAALLGALVMAVGAPLWSRLYFEDASHTLHFLGLAPLVAFVTLAGGELAVLKGLRRINALATTSLLASFFTLLITAAAYAALGTAGIIPALTLSALSTLLLQGREAHRTVPYRVRLHSRRFLLRGLPMVRLGLAYAAANFIEYGGQSLVQATIVRFPEAASGFLPSQGLQTVGIYGVGITLLLTYSRMVFTAMDAEYYPRLSASIDSQDGQNLAVNRQMTALVLLVAPFGLAFLLFLPLIVRLLYTAEFLPVVPMVAGGVLALWCKALATPIAYLPLAHAHSRLYLWIEASYTLTFVLSTIGGYLLFGLAGAGWGISLSYGVYFLTVWHTYRSRFGFVLSGDTLRHVLPQGVLILAGVAVTFLIGDAIWSRSLILSILLATSLACSFRLLQRHTDWVHRMCNTSHRIFRRVRRHR